MYSLHLGGNNTGGIYAMVFIRTFCTIDMTRILAVIFLCLNCLCTSAQHDLFETQNRWAEYYRSNPKYVFIETTTDSPEVIDTIELNFSKYDSLELILPGRNTVNWATLFAVQDTLKEKLRSDDCDATQFMTLKVYKSDESDYLLKISGCWTRREVYIWNKQKQ